MPIFFSQHLIKFEIHGVAGDQFVDDAPPLPLKSRAGPAAVDVAEDVGDSVKIIDGALASFIGTVEELDKERGKVRVVVSMFGRETPVELELDQVETI